MSGEGAGKISKGEIESILETFAQRYIRREFRSRFLHEAKKNPGRLNSRVCHRTEQLFEERLKAKLKSLPQSGECLVLYNSGFAIEAWSACDANFVLADGGLIISHGGSWFWARSEPQKGVLGIDYHSPADQ